MGGKARKRCKPLGMVIEENETKELTMQVVTNDTTRLIESILRQGDCEDLGNWRVIDLETDALRRLGAKPIDSCRPDKLGWRHTPAHKRKGYKARAARVVHGDGEYKLCYFRDDLYGKFVGQMSRSGGRSAKHPRDANDKKIDLSGSACGNQTRLDTVSGTTLRGMIYLYDGDNIPLCVGCCEVIAGSMYDGVED